MSNLQTIEQNYTTLSDVELQEVNGGGKGKACLFNDWESIDICPPTNGTFGLTTLQVN